MWTSRFSSSGTSTWVLPKPVQTALFPGDQKGDNWAKRRSSVDNPVVIKKLPTGLLKILCLVLLVAASASHKSVFCSVRSDLPKSDFAVLSGVLLWFCIRSTFDFQMLTTCSE